MPVASGGSGGGTASAIRAGAAFVELFVKDNMLVRGLSAAKKRFEQFGGFMKSTGKKFMLAGGGILAPIVASLAGGIGFAAELDDLADTFGTTTEALSPLAYAFRVAGLSLEDLGTAMKGVAKNEKSGRPLEEVFMEQALALNDIEDPAQRARKAMEQFGKAGLKVASVAEALKELKDLGFVMDANTAKDAEKIQMQFKLVQIAVEQALLPVIGMIVPIITKVTKWIQENKSLVKIIGLIGIGLVVAGATMSLVGVGLSTIGSILGLVVSGFGLLGAAIGFLFTPIGLAVAAIAGGTAAFLTFSGTGQKAVTEIADGFKAFASVAVDSWGGIVAAIGKGDLELAAEIAFATVKVGWASLLLFLTKSWNSFKGFFVDGWHEVGFGVSLVWNEITTGLESALRFTLKAVIDMFNGAIKALAGGAAWLLDKVGLDDTANDLRDVGQIGTGWLDRWQAQIDKNHQAEEDRIGRELNARLEANKKFRDANERQAQDDLARAEADRQRLVAKAKEEVKKDVSPGLKADAKPLDLAAMVRGAFQSPNWRQSFAVGDKINERILNVQRAQLEAVKGLKQVLLNLQVLRIA